MTRAQKDLLFFVGLFIVFSVVGYLFLFTPLKG